MALTGRAQARGLMEVEEIPDDYGMVFLWSDSGKHGFYMKDTLIPLSIAFFDRDGVILDILDMDPCEADPCPSYGPGAMYQGALEVNQGAFDAWGVAEGDLISVSED